jgi:hypothetical protein
MLFEGGPISADDSVVAKREIMNSLYEQMPGMQFAKEVGLS